ncbi:hypothetical protein [Fuscibacter oryzae]|uniref:Uncharacterized protein n=1 Tax=Fuscibacter oryzae TaxID=2803939 RepID=A0A8J7MZM7_9RHOB|nr:hypothetical protein [Fuscibacter oryzae]MBL4929804.1 hypothetical protein [Fuscibacter oryzae]
MMRRSLLALCLLVAGFPATADTAGNPALARQGFDACVAAFGDPVAGLRNLKADGWDYVGSEGVYQWTTKANRRVVIALGRKGHPTQGCFASYNKMTNRQAMDLAAKIASDLHLKATAAKQAYGGTIWVGSVHGRGAALNVVPVTQYDFHKGAAVLLLAQE